MVARRLGLIGLASSACASATSDGAGDTVAGLCVFCEIFRSVAPTEFIPLNVLVAIKLSSSVTVFALAAEPRPNGELVVLELDGPLVSEFDAWLELETGFKFGAGLEFEPSPRLPGKEFGTGLDIAIAARAGKLVAVELGLKFAAVVPSAFNPVAVDRGFATARSFKSVLIAFISSSGSNFVS